MYIKMNSVAAAPYINACKYQLSLDISSYHKHQSACSWLCTTFFFSSASFQYIDNFEALEMNVSNII